MARRSFGPSVVITFSLVELACAGMSEDQTLHRNPPPLAEGEAPEGEVAEGEAAEGEAADAKIVEGEGETPKIPTMIEPKTHISRGNDGTCWETVTIDCPPNIACNPPPPREVDCPEDTLPDATVAANVTVHDDGTCTEFFVVDDCPPNTACNPPPPRQVNCPPKTP